MQLFASWQHNYFLIHNPHQFAEDVFNAILVNLKKKKKKYFMNIISSNFEYLAVFSLDSDSNEKKKTDNLHSALTIDSD